MPPQGYLEVESRNSPTSPRALRRLARAAVKAGLCWNPGNPLPVQSYVEAHERARLVFHARRELPRVTAVASQVMLVDSRLAEAEETLRQATSHRSAAAASARRAPDQPGTAVKQAKAGQHTAGRDQPSDTGHREQPAARPPLLDPWSEAAILVMMAAGQGVLAYAGTGDAGLGAVARAMLALTSAVGWIVAAQLAARGAYRLGSTPEGSEDPRRRRRVDVAVACGALACGVTLAATIGRLRSGAGSVAMGLALLGLATAASYAATACAVRTTNSLRWRSVSTLLRRLQRDRRRRRQLQTALASEAAAQAAVRELREELVALVPQLLAAEQSALLFWRYQVAIGDAAQRGFEQHLAAYSMRRSRGIWRPITDWWRGAAPAEPRLAEDFRSVGDEQPDWGDQVGRITTAAKRVLVRRGLLDITHGLRRPPLPGTSLADHNGSPASSYQDPLSDGHQRPVERSVLDGEQPGRPG